MSEIQDLPERGLTRRAVNAGFALAVMTGIERGLLFIRAVLLARLLEPREFGLMGMAFIAINAAEVLSQTGFGRAIVQRRDDPAPFLDTIWIVGVVRGFLLAGVIFGGAPLLAGFFRTPEAQPVLQAVSLGMVLRGFMSPAWILLERRLSLTRYAMPRTIGAAADMMVTCTLAFPLRSVWAMVLGFLAGTAVTVALSYVVGPYRPRLRIEASRARGLYAFGKHIFRTEVMVMLSGQVDRLAVGRIGDVTSLGFYSFAHRMATLPIAMFSMVIIRVIFPSFARIQEDPERVRVAYVRLMQMTAITSFPVAMGMLAAAPELVPVVFGDRWIPMIDAFRILCFLGTASALERSCSAVTGGIGLPRLASSASMIRLVLMSLLIVPATWLGGIEGAAFAATSSQILSTAYLLLSLGRATGTRLRSLIPALGVPSVACVAVFVTMEILRAWTSSLPAAAALAVLMAAGALAYVLVTAVMDRVSGSGLTTTLLGLIRSR